MYKKVRLRLTLVCALGTLVVLVGMAVLSFLFSVRQLTKQGEASFASNVNAVLLYLQGADTIDSTWLAQTEATDDLAIQVGYGGHSLEYAERDTERAGIRAFAEALARETYPALWQEGAKSLGAVSEQFGFSLDGKEYRAAVCLLPKEAGLYHVIVVKSLAAEAATKRELLLFYGLGTLGAALALALFAWFFSGRAVRPAMEAAKKQTEFLSAASHELRSPLAVIRMSAGSIKTLPDRAGELADKIENECARLSRLVGDLLVLGGGEAGMRVQKEEASPQTILLLAFERFEALAAAAGLRLELDAPDTLPPAAHWDVGRIEQALAVLLDNAVAYVPAGGRVRLGLCIEKGNAVYTVEDTGPGIPPEDREKVFRRFYRADEARSAKEHYGLGLAVAREIARLHGGTLVAEEAKVLAGARFRLVLPLGRSVGI